MHSNKASSREVMRRLDDLGVRGWDDLSYSRIFNVGMHGGRAIVEEAPHEDFCNITLACLKDLFGYTDDQGNFVNARNGCLMNGARSARNAFGKHKAIISRIKNGSASIQDCLELLNDIKTVYAADDGCGPRLIGSCIDSLHTGLRQGQLKAWIWRRDPWTDTLSCIKWHCCAFFKTKTRIRDDLNRGIGQSVIYAITNGYDGAILQYLKTKSISMLDIVDSRSNMCRVTMIIAVRKGGDEDGEPVLIVESADGTTRMPPLAIRAMARG